MSLNRDQAEFLQSLGYPPEMWASFAPKTLSRPAAPTPSSAPVATRVAPAPLVAPSTAPLPRAPSALSNLAWGELETRALKCTQCALANTRQNVVFGEGDQQAELMFVGEGPGADEDASGRPFVGAAGQLLTKMIEAMGLSRERVYIANVVKCRPPGNRNPEPGEIAACSPYLQRQIELVSPKVIVCLGTFAAQTLLQNPDPIGRLRGRPHTHAALVRTDGSAIQVLPTYHPAFCLRNPEMKKPVWEDLKHAMALLGLPGKA